MSLQNIRKTSPKLAMVEADEVAIETPEDKSSSKTGAEIKTITVDYAGPPAKRTRVHLNRNGTVVADVLSAFAHALKLDPSRVQLWTNEYCSDTVLDLKTPVAEVASDLVAVDRCKFRIDLSDTMLEGIGYCSITHSLGTPPPIAKHGMVFMGRALVSMPKYVQVLDQNHKYDGLLLPISCDEARNAITRCEDQLLPLRDFEPRPPLEPNRPLAPHVLAAWQHFFDHGWEGQDGGVPPSLRKPVHNTDDDDDFEDKAAATEKNKKSTSTQGKNVDDSSGSHTMDATEASSKYPEDSIKTRFSEYHCGTYSGDEKE